MTADSAPSDGPAAERARLALGLDETGVTLHLRGTSGGWVAVGSARLQAEDFAGEVEALRRRAVAAVGTAGPALLWLPPEQVLSCRLPAAEVASGGAREIAARIASDTPYGPGELVLAQGAVAADGMIPVYAALRQTWEEALAYARIWKFTPAVVSVREAEAGGTAPCPVFALPAVAAPGAGPAAPPAVPDGAAEPEAASASSANATPAADPKASSTPEPAARRGAPMVGAARRILLWLGAVANTALGTAAAAVLLAGLLATRGPLPPELTGRVGLPAAPEPALPRSDPAWPAAAPAREPVSRPNSRLEAPEGVGAVPDAPPAGSGRPLADLRGLTPVAPPPDPGPGAVPSTADPAGTPAPLELPGTLRPPVLAPGATDIRRVRAALDRIWEEGTRPGSEPGQPGPIASGSPPPLPAVPTARQLALDAMVTSSESPVAGLRRRPSLLEPAPHRFRAAVAPDLEREAPDSVEAIAAADGPPIPPPRPRRAGAEPPSDAGALLPSQTLTSTEPLDPVEDGADASVIASLQTGASEDVPDPVTPAAVAPAEGATEPDPSVSADLLDPAIPGAQAPLPPPRPAALAARRAARTGPQSLDAVRLLGVLDIRDARQALLMLPDARVLRVTRGDSVQGWQVVTIERDTISLRRGAARRTLSMPSN